MNNKKIIRDPIHGNIELKNIFIDLLNSPELQRLYNIKQLGFAHLVFPGAHHSRLEHSLGSYYIASEIAKSVNLNQDERDIIRCAALIHDIGHGPFSHTLEVILHNYLSLNHIELTKRLIYGEYDILQTGEKKFISHLNVNEILEKEKLDIKLISSIITGDNNKKKYLTEILNSCIDSDQLDYLMRDAFYTGVAYGIIDLERFLQTLEIFNGKLVIHKKGVGVVENILMARNLMYSSVYFHKTVRIAELMLLKSIQMLPDLHPLDLFKKTDTEILNFLKNKGSFQNKIITSIKYRNLFKQSYSISNINLDKTKKNVINSFKKLDIKIQKENEIEDKLKIPKGHVIIDVPKHEIDKTEPRLNKIDITILDNNLEKKFEHLTPIAKAIQSKSIPDWAIMIITDEKYRKIVEKKAEKILFN